ncbi:MAG: DUF4147 domain-containing protein [Chitinivibrionales bacterium]|nr:DUF4147 domain-containing protein [Chitinivibrionales bacterium]
MPPGFSQYQAHLNLLRNAALKAVDPAAAVARFLSGNDFADAKRVFLVGAGKAGVAMAVAASAIAGNRLTRGIVSVPEKQLLKLPHVDFYQGGHPVPNDGSVAAGLAVADLLEKTTADDLVVALISGGGSALLELPCAGLGLQDLQNATSVLLRSGAAIHESNIVRSFLSQIKSGGLLRLAYPARVLGLILSDVVGSKFETIASGPTVPTEHSAEMAQAIIKKYRLSDLLPEAVMSRLLQKRDYAPDKNFRVENRLIASNRDAGIAAAAAAQKLGFNAAFEADDWQGEAPDIGRKLARLLIDNVDKRPVCRIVGGETTVAVHGAGSGGRNQEAALAAAQIIAGRRDIIISTFATDGVDGPTDAAGATVTGETITRAQALGLDPEKYLENNDSYAFFEALGDLVKTGPTGTNVNDLMFGLGY